MKKSDYSMLMAMVFVAPTLPEWGALLNGMFWLVLALVWMFKE